MSYNTEADLRKIVNVSADDDLTIFLDNANLLLTEELSAAGHSEARLTMIELYLAAHFVTLAYENGGLVGKKIDDTTEWYQKISLDAQGFKSTRYGQQALSMDSSGVLIGMSTNKPRALFRVV